MRTKNRFCTAVLVALLMAVSCLTGLAAENPFEENTLACARFRIPALLTKHDGGVIASADLRWNHGTDAPENLDIAAAVSPDGYGNWTYTVPNRLDDYADGTSSKQSAAFIDSALLQGDSGRIFMLCDLFPSGVGYPNAKEGSGCLTKNGKRYLALASRGSEDYRFHIADFDGDFAPVMEDARPTGYSVDRAYRLYQNGTLCTQAQKGFDDAPTGDTVPQTVFYSDAAFHVFPTSYLCLRHSDDGGVTWSAPTLLNPAVKHEGEAFLGVCPGRGVSVTVDGHERLIFPLYSNEKRREHALTLFSDDGGETWQRGDDVRCSLLLQKTSESQIVTLPDGKLRMFSRTGAHFVGFCDSADGGKSWTKAKPDYALRGTKNCMVSFINTSKTIDGKPVVLCAMGSNVKNRADGVLRVGVVEENNRIHWIKTTPVNAGFFAYSCLTELSDGKFALLFEDEAAHFCYRIFTLQDDGSMVPADGTAVQDAVRPSFADRLLELFARLMQSLSCK